MAQAATGAPAPQEVIGKVQLGATAEQMLDRLNAIRSGICDPGLDPVTLAIERAVADDLEETFWSAAHYAQMRADRLGITYPNPLAGLAINGTSPEVATAPESLTAEQTAFKESLLEGLASSHRTYIAIHKAINKKRDSNNKLVPATIAENRELAEVQLTDDVIRDLHAQLLEARSNPIMNSPEPGFDVLFVANEYLTRDDHNAVANAVQGMIPMWGKLSSEGRPYVSSEYHQGTNQILGTTRTRIVIAARHLTLATGNRDTQLAVVEAHNVDSGNHTTLVTADALGNMTAIAHTVRTNPNNIDWKKDTNNMAKLLWATYYRGVEAQPAGSCVPRWCVSTCGQFVRDHSGVGSGDASRALVVPRA